MRNDRGVDQDVRLSWQKDDGTFEWIKPDGKVEFVDESTFKTRGGKVNEWDLTGLVNGSKGE